MAPEAPEDAPSHRTKSIFRACFHPLMVAVLLVDPRQSSNLFTLLNMIFPINLVAYFIAYVTPYVRLL